MIELQQEELDMAEVIFNALLEPRSDLPASPPRTVSSDSRPARLGKMTKKAGRGL